MDQFCSILKTLRKQQKITQDELAKLLGVGKTTVSNYETGYSSPDKDNIIKMASIFNVSIDYLLGRVSAKEGAESASHFMLHKNTVMMQIPIFGMIQNTSFLQTKENIIDYVDLPKDYLGNGEYFGYRMYGDSMNLNKINDGDYVLIRRQSYVDNGDLALVLIKQEATIRRYYQQGKYITLMPASNNPAHQPTFYETGYEVTILGKPIKAIVNI